MFIIVPIFLLLPLPRQVLADAALSDSSAYQLEPVVITASRYARHQVHISENTSVIGYGDLQNVPAHNLLEALNFTPGIAIRKTGGVGTRELLSIQGSEPRHVTVLLDGMPLNNISASLADPVQIPLEQVERVEIVKGPISTAWGPALGGVVHIFSPRLNLEPDFMISAFGSYGRWNTHQRRISLKGGTGSAGYMVAASQTTTDGFRPKSAHDGRQVFGKMEGQLGKFRVGLSYGYLGGETEDFEEFGLPIWKFHEYSTQYGQAYILLHKGWHAQVRVFGIGRGEEIHYLGTNDDQLIQSFILDEPIWGSAIEWVGENTNYGRFSGGMDLRLSEANFGFLRGPEEKRFDEQGIYANWNRQWRTLSMNGGLHFYNHSLYGSVWSPAAGLVYSLDEGGMLLRLHVGRGFGAPPLSAAFSPETERFAPNPNLRAERITAYNLGLESLYFEQLRFRATFFRNEVEDAIDTAINNEGKFFQKNFAEQTRQGVEIEIHLAPIRGLSVKSGMAFNEVVGENEDEIINGTARWTNDLVVQYWNEHWGLQAWLGGHYADYEIANVLKEPPTSFTSRDARFIWDAKVMQNLPRWVGIDSSIYVAGFNLFATEFWWLTPYPLPGRAIEIGLLLKN